MSNVFIIMNEWTDTDGGAHSELTGGKYFTSQDSAHEALSLIAESFGETIAADDLSFTMENSDAHTEFEEYYIQELSRGDN